jgi:hypothetical protein
VNISTENSHTFLAPNRREAQPLIGITAASDSRYPVTTHWIELSDACSSRLRVSSATLTIVVSRIDMIVPSTITGAMRQTYGLSFASELWVDAVAEVAIFVTFFRLSFIWYQKIRY